MNTEASSVTQSSARIVVGGVLLCAAACTAPLLFGAATNRSVAVLLLASVLSLLVAPRPRSPWTQGLVVAIGAGFLIYCLIALLQLWLLGQWFPVPLLVEAQDALGAPDELARAATLNPSRIGEALPRSALVTAALLAAVLLGQSRRFAYRCLDAIVLAGLTTVIGALILHHVDPGSVLWQQKKAYLTDFTATFISRGAAGAWLCLIATTSLALLVRHVSRLLEDDIPDGAAAVTRMIAAALHTPMTTLFLLAGVAVPAYGLLLTESRLALLVLGIQVAGLAIFLAVYGSRRSAVAGLLAASIVIAAGVALLWAGGGGITKRILDSDLTRDGRWAIWQSTLAGIFERPVLGFGAGTLRDGFPLFRSEQLIAFGEVRSAHSLPLELAFESGVVVASLVSAAWIAVCIVLASRVLRLEKFDGLSAAALAAATGAVCFTGFDVASQSFGYVLPMLVVVGLGLAQMDGRLPRERHGGPM